MLPSGALLAGLSQIMVPSNDFIDDSPLLDALTTAVVCLDEELIIIYVNTAAEQLLQASARKCLNRSITDVVSLPAHLLERFGEAVSNGQPFTDRQITVTLQGGEETLVDCSLSPYDGYPGATSLLVEFTAVDLPLRIARDQAMKSQQEHASLLLRGLAHEIKNPLGGLRGAAQLLERQLPDPELRDYTSIIIQEADRLQGLLDRMLGPVSRPSLDQINVHEVLEHVRKISLAGAPPGVRVHADYDPSIPELVCDRDRLVQVLLNIVGNALQAIGELGTITLRTRVLHNSTIGSQRHRLVAALSIRDDGPGIPEQLLDQIFYPMVTGTDNGTGLGLSIAQSMMNQIGGFIDCRSEPGDTVFTVLIPLETS